MNVKSKLMIWRRRVKRTASASPKSTQSLPVSPQLFQGCATTSEIAEQVNTAGTINGIRAVLAGMREDTRIIQRKLEMWSGQ